MSCFKNLHPPTFLRDSLLHSSQMGWIKGSAMAGLLCTPLQLCHMWTLGLGSGQISCFCAAPEPKTWELLLPLIPSLPWCWIQRGEGGRGKAKSSSVHPLGSRICESPKQLMGSVCMYSIGKLGGWGGEESHMLLALFLDLLLLANSMYTSHIAPDAWIQVLCPVSDLFPYFVYCSFTVPENILSLLAHLTLSASAPPQFTFAKPDKSNTAALEADSKTRLCKLPLTYHSDASNTLYSDPLHTLQLTSEFPKEKTQQTSTLTFTMHAKKPQSLFTLSQKRKRLLRSWSG